MLRLRGSQEGYSFQDSVLAQRARVSEFSDSSHH
jgi:hypothetical protein